MKHLINILFSFRLMGVILSLGNGSQAFASTDSLQFEIPEGHAWHAPSTIKRAYTGDEYPGYIKVFQAAKQKAEILYNRVSIFDRIARFYLAIGLSLLIILLVQIFCRKKWLNRFRRIMVIHLLAGFGMHSIGLILRLYISGHAPWSNGYEALIYISWASMLAGVIFSRRTAAPLAATALLSWMILHAARIMYLCDISLNN